MTIVLLFLEVILVLKRVKNWQRSTIRQNKLFSLSIFAAENDLVKESILKKKLDYLPTKSVAKKFCTHRVIF